MNVDNAILYKDLLLPFPWRIMQEEINNDKYSGVTLSELREIMHYYNVYNYGAEFRADAAQQDYIPSSSPFQIVKSIIDKQARFMFGKTPEFTVNMKESNTGLSKEMEEKIETMYQDLIDSVLTKNKIGKNLIAALKDCFIGKRVAAILNFNENSGITIQFVPSHSFYCETDMDTGEVTKICTLFRIYNSEVQVDERIYKKVYEMGEDGYCYVSEGIYDGVANLVEEVIEYQRTEFTYVPAYVFINDGLSGDTEGVSEVTQLQSGEEYFSKLANADIDANRFGMNPIIYTVDMNPQTTKRENLSIAAGAFWDLQTDQALSEKGNGKVGLLEKSMSYTSSLEKTLDRTRNNMYDLTDLPDIRGIEARIASGKALKALYWPLIVRSDEKMQEWRPGLEFIAETIIKGSNLYPYIARMHLESFEVVDVELEVSVENLYPLPEDEELEKQLDMAEIASQTRSRKSYLMKWNRITPEQADEELKQIILEKQLMASSVTGSLTSFANNEAESIESIANTSETDSEVNA